MNLGCRPRLRRLSRSGRLGQVNLLARPCTRTYTGTWWGNSHRNTLIQILSFSLRMFWDHRTCLPLIGILPAGPMSPHWPLVNTSGCRLPVGDGLAEHHFQISRVGASDGDVLALQKTVLGKRCREGDDALDDGKQEAEDSRRLRPCKKGKVKIVTTDRVSEVGGSTQKAPHKSAAAPHKKNSKSKAVGRGAGRLTAPNTQGVYHLSLKGPSVQQGAMSTIAQEQPPWVEGSVEVAAWHDIGMVQEQGVAISADSGEPEPAVVAESPPFQIPKRLDERDRAMLAATAADWARGSVPVIKCRLCPGTDFSKWDAFTRHAKAAEAHPYRISYCDSCGDYFARSDSLKRHRKNRPSECREVRPEIAKEKRRATATAHEDFLEREAHCLRTGERLETPCSEIVKTMYPGSSKRRSRQQRRLQASN